MASTHTASAADTRRGAGPHWLPEWPRALAVRVAASIRRRLAERRLRREMERERQHPERARATIASARHILVLCHGNIIRSPFTERLLARALGPRCGITIRSAGLGAVAGRLSPVAPVLAADLSEIDLRDHAAAPVTAEAVAEADVVFVMDVPQLAAMRRRFPDARDKTFLLACLAPDTPLEVRDPVMGGQTICRNAFDHIERAVRPLVLALSHRTTPS